jgi:acyl carrier protein
MTDHKLRSLIIDVLRQVAPEADLQTLDPDRSFRDQFGIDSIDYLNMIMAIEEKLKLRIAECDYPKLSSLKGCMAYLANCLDTADKPIVG